jgi:hypothetical protein
MRATPSCVCLIPFRTLSRAHYLSSSFSFSDMQSFGESDEPAPFTEANQLCNDLDLNDANVTNSVALPGHPWLNLNDVVRMKQFLKKEFCAQDLETMAPHLWIMSTQSSANVNPLHRQRVKGREIVVTEEPRLHLVWLHDRIFLKPLPKYLLSHAFWEGFLDYRSSRLGSCRETIQRAALGYLRTYRHLIQHESDFRIAQQDDLRLIPQGVQWPDYCRFMSEFNRISDCDVSARYCYGELRLSRLNLYAPLLLRKPRFEQTHSQYSDYFARLYGPVLFLFAIISTLLNSMQVGLAADQISSKPWVSLWLISRWFSITCLVGTAIVLACFVLLWTWKVLDEWIFAVKDRVRKTQGRLQHSKC